MLKNVAPGCPISDRWGVGIHFALNSRPGNFSQIDFFTSSCHRNLVAEICHEALDSPWISWLFNLSGVPTLKGGAGWLSARVESGLEERRD